MSAAIRLENLTLGYDRHPAVHHLSGDIPQGALMAVVGPNGAGKSTLLKGLVGALKPLSGAIRRDRDNAMAYLPQRADIDETFPITTFDLVAMGAWAHCGSFGRVGPNIRHDIEHAFHAVGLEGFESRPVSTLSGGQLQRALFARLILQNARTILLDEPFAAIDQKTAHDLMHLIHTWHGEKRTVIAVLHDLHLVRKDFPETLLLAREKVSWAATSEALSDENIAAAQRMIEAFDNNAHFCER